jgi:hypothetical protein
MVSDSAMSLASVQFAFRLDWPAASILLTEDIDILRDYAQITDIWDHGRFGPDFQVISDQILVHFSDMEEIFSHDYK